MFFSLTTKIIKYLNLYKWNLKQILSFLILIIVISLLRLVIDLKKFYFNVHMIFTIIVKHWRDDVVPNLSVGN